jgi:hypothetical protein
MLLIDRVDFAGARQAVGVEIGVRRLGGVFCFAADRPTE